MDRRALSRLAKSIIFCLGVVVMLSTVNFIMTPSIGTLNGWAASRAIRGQVDVIALGSSRTYCTVLPMEMWREAGVTAVDITAAIQIMPVTLGYLEEAVKTQHPRVVLVELYMVGKRSTFDVTTAHKSLDYMPFGVPKMEAVSRSVEPKNWFEFLFPLHLYHSRWSQLDRTDFALDKHSSYAYGRGAMYLADQEPLTVDVTADVMSDYSYQTDLVFIREMARVCEENGAQLVLFVSPSPYRLAVGDQLLLERLRQDISPTYPRTGYLDLNEVAAVADVNPQTDYKDDLHVNQRGATKLSRWLANQLTAEYGLADHRGDEFADQWDADLKTYDLVFKSDW